MSANDIPQINVSSDNWFAAEDRVNQIINAYSTTILTANLSVAGAQTTGNATVNGVFGANTLVAANLQGGTLQTPAVLKITTNTQLGNVATTPNSITVGNSSINSVINSTSVSTDIINDLVSFSIGANVVGNTTQITIGNSTVNSAYTAASIIVANTTNTATLTPISLTIGTTVVNTTVVQSANITSTGNMNFTSLVGTGTISVGANAFLNSTAVFLGNSTVNNLITFTGLSLNSGNVVVNNTTLFLGNSTVNSIITVTGHTQQNSLVSSVLSKNQLFIGNSSVNTVINSSTVSVGGATLLTSTTRSAAWINASTTYVEGAFNIISGNGMTCNVTNDSADGLINVNIAFTGSTSGAPGGSNTFVSFNDSATFGGAAGLTFNKVSNNVFIGNTTNFGNSTVNTVINSTSLVIASTVNTATLTPSSLTLGPTTVVNTSVINGANLTSSGNVNGVSLTATTSAVVGANVLIDTAKVFIGNSTVNSVSNSTQHSLANSTATATLVPTSLTVGSTVVNTTVVQVANVNSTGNLNGVSAVLTTSLTVGANVSVNTGTVSVGNSTVNSVSNSSQLAIANSTATTTINPTSVTVGSTVVNTTVVQVANVNSTGNVNGVSFIGTTSVTVGANVSLSTSTLNLGNTTVNVAINSSSLSINGTALVAATNSEFLVGTNNYKYVSPATLVGGATPFAQTFASSMALNFQNGLNFNIGSITATSFTLANATNLTPGYGGTIMLPINNNNVTMAKGSMWKFIGGTPTPTATSGSLDSISYYIANSTVILASYNKAFS